MGVIQDSDPSIEEMRHELAGPKAGRREYFKLVSHHRLCFECGARKADWWFILNGRAKCNNCVTKN